MSRPVFIELTKNIFKHDKYHMILILNINRSSQASRYHETSKVWTLVKFCLIGKLYITYELNNKGTLDASVTDCLLQYLMFSNLAFLHAVWTSFLNFSLISL